MTTEGNATTKGKGISSALRRWLPWVVTIASFVYVFSRVPYQKVLDAAIYADMWSFIPLVTFNVAMGFLWETLVFTVLFKRFGAPVTYRGMLPIRGATYLVWILNYFAGMGGMALLMNRWKKISISRASSVVIFGLFLDYYTLLALCLAGAFRLPGVDLASISAPTEAGRLVRFIVISWAFFAAHIWFYRWLLPRARGLERAKRAELLAAFREAPLSRYVELVLLKAIGFFSFGIIIHYFALASFGLRVPFLTLTVMLPIVWLITAIPISVMGMGTGQAAMIWLIARYAQSAGTRADTEAAVLAYSLLMMIMMNLGRLVIGAVSAARLPGDVWGTGVKSR